MPKERINIENIDGQMFEIKVIEPDDFKPVTNIKGKIKQEEIRKITPSEYARILSFYYNYLSASLSDPAFRSNLFFLPQKKDFNYNP